MDEEGIYADIKPNYELYPNGLAITQEMQDYLTEVLEDNDYEIC